jgi:hypothetical protein
VTFLRIGRAQDNDIVINDARVSGHHARLIVIAGGQTLIEDLGSSNGTFLNSVDQRASGPDRIAESDTLYFGSLAIPAAELLGRLKRREAVTPAPAQSAPGPTARAEPAVAPPAIAWLQANRWLLAAAAQAPIFAALIVLLAGRQAAGAASWASAGEAIASTSFALALAAIWLGCSAAVADHAAGRLPGPAAGVEPAQFFTSLGSRLAARVVVCAVGCALLLAIVYLGSGLKGPWLVMWGLLVLASVVGLLFGLVVLSLNRSWTIAAAVLLVCFVPMIALGGCFLRLTGMSPPIAALAAAMPSRWAFEGLLLLESPHHPAPMTAEASKPEQNRDIAEDYFPTSTERMGPKADAMALGSMLIGMAALAAFIAGFGGSAHGRLK